MNYFKEWQMLRRSDFFTIGIITAIFLLVIVMNDRLIFKITTNQTEEIGKMQLEVIRSDFQGALQSAEATTMRLAMEAEQLMRSGATHEQLTTFFVKRHREQKNLTGGVCFNVYIAGKNWVIFPDWTAPPDYHATERNWYRGAVENQGKIYITEPYIDAMTGGMCYTMSKMLSDGETVVSIDFNFADVYYLIKKMTELGNRQSLIVTKSGMIIGYTDMDLVGKKISNELPGYEGILNRVIQSEHHDSFTMQLDGSEHTIFSSETTNGWYMILCVDNWAFYKDSYIQIIVTTLLSLIMMLAIIIFYLNARSNGLRAENALRVKEEFLSRLSHELRDPLHKILDLSSSKTVESDADPAECAAKVRESALKLSDMLDNLFSFSTLVSNDNRKTSAAKKFKDNELSKVSSYSRIGIISVLIAAMMVAFGICIDTTISWGDTKMHRELDTYEYQLSNWIEKQKSVLGMFVNVISNNPKIVDDYDSAVKFLDDLAKRYPDISVCYIGNPYKPHPMTMNNGWVPDSNFKVEERPWYKEAEKSDTGFSVSAPYYDAQTGVYCVTLSQMVYGTNGEFLGIFAIDFYLDKLVKVLGDSYSKDGYAFLVDNNGIIINHPNNEYQQSIHRTTDISNTEYAKVFSSNEVLTLKDYAGEVMACLAKKNEVSNFTVIVANSWWNIYGNIILLGGFLINLLLVCVLIVRFMINRLLDWQDSVNGQLKAASDTAVAASKAKSQFLAQMSHEIRTPINAVLGMNEMILRECKTETILDYSSNIQSAGRTLLTLINSILDFSKIEDGKMEIVPVRYETISLIDDLVNMTAERAKKKGLELRTEIDSNLPKSLYGDDVRLRQVITNILTNAVKYTHKGSVTLSIKGEEIDADTLNLSVKVSDTGIGIHEEDIDKLFLSFQRLDEEKNRNIEGTGLGISIVQKLLDMMGSKLEVKSEYGKGSTFSFVITQKIVDKTPLGDYNEHHTKNHEEKNSAKKFLTAEGARVLAVDDNDMNLKVISGLLKRNKIFPDLADSGLHGIEMVKKKFYQIIFLDNMMPVMNGIETLKKMRREKILNDKTKVIMLTASAIAGMREIYLSEGFDDYLSKPIDVSELEKMLEKYLPSELIKFEEEDTKKVEVPKKIKDEPKVIKEEVHEEVHEEVAEEVEEKTNTDTFSDAEREKFTAICPDINLETGLKYCMDSKDFMMQMLAAFTDPKKADKIQEKFDASDWKGYQILVHALKSTSLSIGAENLSAAAKSLELAAKNKSVEEILANHANLMADYKKVREEIEKWLKEAGA